MDKPIDTYWERRLGEVREALEDNNFEVHIAPGADQAKDIVLNTILPATNAKILSWGGSMTFTASGLYHHLRDSPDYEIIDTYDKKISPEEKNDRRRQALLSDCYFMGANALTEHGMLVNLDMYGNRVGALAFGPRHVVVLVGRNKLCADLDDAMYRIKNYAAPVNAMRLDMKTSCLKTARCGDCKSEQRICNVWTITEKSFPKGRIKIVLINQDLGF